MDWRESLDPRLREHFNELLKEVSLEKEAYLSAKNVSRAQLWCALAVLMKDVSDLHLKIQELEKKIPSKVNVSLKKELEKL